MSGTGVYEQRRDNLKKLLDQKYDGTISGLADCMRVSHNIIWRVLTEGKHRRNIGEDLARRIEAATGVPSGYLDLNEQDQKDSAVLRMAERIHALPKRNREAILEMLDLIESGSSSA